MDRKRTLVFFRNYFNEFLETQKEKVKEKIDYVLFLITTAERIPKKFFSYVEGTDGLFEIRIEFESNIYRVFVALTKAIWLFYSTDFKRKPRKLLKMKLIKP